MRGLLRIFSIALAVLLLLSVAVGVGAYLKWTQLSEGPLPDYDGEVIARWLDEGVEVLRDRYGVPHIYAENLNDLFFAQGYVQAQDRWWQMDLFRHVGFGALSALVGKNEEVLRQDVLMRTLNLGELARREARSMPQPYHGYLQSFTNGVNAYLETRKPGQYGIEYNFLSILGRSSGSISWTIADSLVMTKVMAFDLSKNLKKESLRAAVYDALGAEVAQAYFPPWPHGERPTIVPGSAVPKAQGSAGNLPSPSPGASPLLLAGGMKPGQGILFGDTEANGSNNWVVAGSKTETGSPLLANDPHLGIRMPSVWYEVGLHAAAEEGRSAFDAVGFALPTSPMIVIGHNASIAWGITNGGADCQDLYRIKLNPDNPLQYEWNGEWRDMTVREETFATAGESGRPSIVVRETHLGPIINDNVFDPSTGEFSGFNLDNPMALRWTGLEISSQYASLYGYNTAQNWDEFRTALDKWETPSQNFVYADVEGNIGYVFAGKVPIRVQGHDGTLPVDGWSDAYVWQGFLPPRLLPARLNPPEGYIGTANQCVVAPSYYARLEEELGGGRHYDINEDVSYYAYRGARVLHLLDKLAPHSIETFRAMQADDFMENVSQILPYIAALDISDPALAKTVEWLGHWDGRFGKESPHAAFFSIYWIRLMDNLFNDQLGDTGRTEGGSQAMWATQQLLKDPQNVWWDDVRTPDARESRDAILLISLQQAHTRANNTLGPSRDGWRWGDVHRVQFENLPLGRSGVAVIEGIMNRGPFSVGGSSDSLNRMRWTADSGTFTVRNIPSMRMIVDVGDWSRSVATNSTGQSGHPYSPHYDDQIGPWLNNQYHPMRWTRQDVEADLAHRMTMLPGKRGGGAGP